MKRLVFIVLTSAGLLSAGAATPVVLGEGDVAAWTNRKPFFIWSAPAAVSWTLPVEGAGAFDLVVAGIEVSPVDRGVVLRLPGQVAPLAAGGPDVPVLARTLPCPQGESYSVEITRTVYQDFGPVQVEPAITVINEFQGEGVDPLRREERKPLPAYYGVAGWWPDPLVVLQEASMGTQKIVRIECRPVQYDPVTGLLRCYRQIEGRLTRVPQVSAP